MRWLFLTHIHPGVHCNDLMNFSAGLLASPSCLSPHRCMGIPTPHAGLCISWWTPWGICWPSSQISPGLSRLKLRHSLCQSLPLTCEFAKNALCVTIQATDEDNEQRGPQCWWTEYKTALLTTLHPPDIKPLIAMSASPARCVAAHLSCSHLLSLQTRLLRDTVSKASLKSMFIKITALSLSTSPIIFLQKAISLIKQDLPLVDLCWLFLITFLSFICLEMDFRRTCSTIFLGTEARPGYSSLSPPSCLVWKQA